MAEAAGQGVALDVSGIPALFGEDQARYLLAVAPETVDALEAAALDGGVPVTRIGTFGGDSVRFGEETATLSELSTLYRSAFALAVG